MSSFPAIPADNPKPTKNNQTMSKTKKKSRKKPGKTKKKSGPIGKRTKKKGPEAGGNPGNTGGH